MAVVPFPVRNKLAYPAGRAPGFNPTHPVATACGLNAGVSAVCLTNGNLYDVLRGRTGTIVTGAGAFTPNISNMGPALQFGSGTTNTNLVSLAKSASLSAASGKALIAGIIRLPTGAATNLNFIIGEYDANGGPNLMIGASSSLLSYIDAAGSPYSYFDYTPIYGHPIFTAISVWLTTLNWVVGSLQSGQTWSGTVSGIVSQATTAQTSTLVNFGNRASNPNLPFAGGSIAAGVFSETPASHLSVGQLQTWAGDPWAFWYPRQTQMLVSTDAAAATQYAAFSIPQRGGRVITQMRGY